MPVTIQCASNQITAPNTDPKPIIIASPDQIALGTSHSFADASLSLTTFSQGAADPQV